MIVAPLPGALGFLLRKALYRYLLAAIGPNVVIGKGVTSVTRRRSDWALA